MKLVKTDTYEGACRRTPNGTVNWMLRSLVSGACGIIFIGYTGWMTSMNGKITSVEAASTLQSISTGGRLSVLETIVASVDTRISRMEGKIDRLLEHWNATEKRLN